jgi:hypothetical protein
MTLDEAFQVKLNGFKPGSLQPGDAEQMKLIWANGWAAAFDRFAMLKPKTPKAYMALMKTMQKEWDRWQREAWRIVAKET